MQSREEIGNRRKHESNQDRNQQNNQDLFGEIAEGENRPQAEDRKRPALAMRALFGNCHFRRRELCIDRLWTRTAFSNVCDGLTHWLVFGMPILSRFLARREPAPPYNSRHGP